jgi:esterase/lipase superfamily enzyme
VGSPNSEIEIQHRILVVAADPESTSRDLLQEEVSTIGASFSETRGTTPIIDAVQTANQDKLTETVSEFRPTIVHFTGHGSPSGRIIYEDRGGWLRNVTGRTLAKAVARQAPRPQCLVLNGCRVSRDLPALRFVADNVISVSHRSDGVDISPLVSGTLYQEIGGGLSFSDAFERLELKLAESRIQESVQTNFYQGEEPSHDLQRSLMGKEFRELREPRSPFLSGAPESQIAFLKDILGDKPPLSVPEDKSGPRLYRVWFGTNREPIDSIDLTKGFGAERSSQIHYGYCDVSVPKYHTIGSIGDPWWKRFPKFWRNNRLAVCTLMPLSGDEYWNSIRAVFDSLTEIDRVLLIFVHGYNVNFDQAVVRAAQLGVDLGIRGATGLFSWPSKGKVASYPADIAAIEASEEVLGDFIVDMANRSGAAAVHLIAHSMGNRGLLRAFSSVVGRISKSLTVPLSQIILAAPDVDTDLFRRLAAAYRTVSKRTTMYVSGKDKALWSSGIVHDYPRAGYAPPVTVVNGIDTVEVTNIDLSFLGHGYIAEAQRVLQDMKMLMEENTPPPRRFGLQMCQTSDLNVYWRMKP